MIPIQNVQSRNDPSHNGPSHNYLLQNDPVTKRPRSRNELSLQVPSRNDPSHEMTQVTKRPRSRNDPDHANIRAGGFFETN
jgi:hypothetical protein